MSRQEDDSQQDFANRVQELLATELGVVSTQITKADKVEHIKRTRHTAPQPATTNLGPRAPSASQSLVSSALRAEDPRLNRMAQQVKDVLPHVPLAVITTDLVQTNCVDTTITNLLERTEEFPATEFPSAAVSEPTRVPPSFLSTSTLANAATAAATIPTIKPAAKLFGKSPVDRHMSLQDRKEALYEYARRRYIEKHGLEAETDP